MNGERPSDNNFMVAAAAAVIDILTGREPILPPELTLPDALRTSIPDGNDISRTWIREQWGWLALTWWCRLKLSRDQRRELQRQHYDLNELGNDYLLYLTSDEGATGGAIRAPASYILASRHPAAVLSEWFGRFVASANGPFERSAYWKLKQRFDDVLGGDPRFALEGGAWRLVERRPAPASESATPKAEGLGDHLAKVVGPIKPFLYKSKTSSQADAESADTIEREDPLIRMEDVIRVAVAAIEYVGPMTSRELALECRKLLPEVLWCEIIRETEERGDSSRGIKDDTNEANHKLPSSSAAYAPKREDDQELPADCFQKLASETWTKLSPAKRIVIAARLFHDPPWTLQQIQDWMVTHLLPEFQMKLQRIHDRAGKDDTLIKAEIRDITPQWLFEDCRRSDLLAFLEAMGTEARKTLATPPSN